MNTVTVTINQTSYRITRDGLERRDPLRAWEAVDAVPTAIESAAIAALLELSARLQEVTP